MRYFRSGAEVFGYSPEQSDLIAAALASGWVEVTGSWPPAAPAPNLQAYADARAASLLSAMREYTVGGVVLKSDATGGTIANLLALSHWGTDNPTATENWIANDYTSTAITGAQFVALAPLVGAYAQLIYGTQLAAVLAGIAAGTITTAAEIDAFAWTA